MTKPIILHPSTKVQTDALLTSLNLNSIGVYGGSGSGKGYFARYLVEKILYISLDSNSPYVKFIDCSNSAGIEQIREIKTFLQLKVPTENKFSRSVVIEQIELLSIPAQNALLKTLEEPPAGTVIIATSANKNNILPTIVSRLQWINLLPLTRNQLDEDIFTSFNSIELERAFLLSEGNAGLLINFLNKPDSYAGFVAAIEAAKAILRSTRFEKLAKIDSILKSDEYTLDQLLAALAKVLRSVMIKNSPSANSQDLTAKLEQVVEAQENMKYNPSHKLILVSLFNNL
ncbi:hypothetical protein KY385_04610 [Candidatus Parcubacteria bacterium]|nr:hypothetical protein [Candidatus Parcubacteria bacterium]